MQITTNLSTVYEQLKQEYHKQLDSETLRKFRILSKAYKVGREIHGRAFNYYKLSHDFEMPYTTVKRVLSLSKANFNTWKKIKEGKISVFKAAQVLMSKDNTYQDEVIDLVIEKNLSTYDIKKLRIRDYKDIEKSRLSKAVEEGFARKQTALYSFMKTLDRLDTLLLLKKEDFSNRGYIKLVRRLKTTQKKLEEYLR